MKQAVGKINIIRGDNMIKEARSFLGWDIWRFIKGRKKTAITVAAFILGYLFTDSATAAVVAGAAVEMIWAVVEYYFKKMTV